MWNEVQGQYKLLGFIGEGSYGTVLQAKCRATGEKVAIKLIKGFCDCHKRARQLLREIKLMRKLSEMDGNEFTTKILKVILPEACYIESEEGKENSAKFNLNKLTHLFMVMEIGSVDLNQYLQAKFDMDEEHLTIILYNLLCSLNFIHTAGIIHRDLKPSNILMSDLCQVQICDFGLSRVNTLKTDFQRALHAKSKELKHNKE